MALSKLNRLLLLAALAVLVSAGLSGCATILAYKQGLPVESTPAGAHVTIEKASGELVYDGTTPATVSLSRNEKYTVTIKLNGYNDATFNLAPGGINLWTLTNIFNGGVGILVDKLTGAVYSLYPSDIHVTLVKKTVSMNDTRVYIVVWSGNDKGSTHSVWIPLQPQG